jgi:hypothetical protein
MIYRTNNGKVWVCDSCNTIHVEFKNVGFKFNPTHFKQFIDYIVSLNTNDDEFQYGFPINPENRVIPIWINDIYMKLNPMELSELRNLLKIRSFGNRNFQIIQTSVSNVVIFLN